MERHAIKMKGHEYKKQEHECKMKEINAKWTKAMRMNGNASTVGGERCACSIPNSSA